MEEIEDGIEIEKYFIKVNTRRILTKIVEGKNY